MHSSSEPLVQFTQSACPFKGIRLNAVNKKAQIKEILMTLFNLLFIISRFFKFPKRFQIPDFRLKLRKYQSTLQSKAEKNPKSIGKLY